VIAGIALLGVGGGIGVATFMGAFSQPQIDTELEIPLDE